VNVPLFIPSITPALTCERRKEERRKTSCAPATFARRVPSSDFCRLWKGRRKSRGGKKKWKKKNKKKGEEEREEITN